MKWRRLLLALLTFMVMPSHSGVSRPAEVLDELNKAALYDKIHHRQYNLRFSVPGLFVGWTGFALDYKISPAVTIGPTAKYFAYGANSGFETGVQMNYALNGDVLSRGWLVNPYLQYYQSNYNHKHQNSSGVVGTNLAYQWIWDNGFNLQLGAGLVYTTIKLPVSISNENIHPNFDFTIGYSF
jgi:hypothetical protein